MIDLGFLMLGIALVVWAFVPILRDRIEQDANASDACDPHMPLPIKEDRYDVITVAEDIEIRLCRSYPYEINKKHYHKLLAEKIAQHLKDHDLIEFYYNDQTRYLRAQIKVLTIKNDTKNEKTKV